MKIKPIYKQKVMDNNLSGPELRKLVQELMTKKIKIVKEDDDDDLGIYGSGFDAHEFDTDAMNAAMADIKASGEKFEPLGTNKFEKNLDVDAMKNDLTRDNLNLPKEKVANKQIQQNLDKRYKHEKRFGAGSLNETGEWSDDEEGTSWKESLKGELEMVNNMLTPGLPFVIKDIEGFDKYQGPFAIIEIDGHKFKVWTLEDNELWVENFPIDNTSGEGQKPGFAGTAVEVADAFNQQYSILTHMNESIIVEFEEDPFEGPQPGDMEYHTNKPNIQKGLGEFKNIDWQMLHEIFVANTEFHNTGKVEGNPKYMEAGVNDLLDDGFLSPEELDLLENRGLIEIVGHYPIISDEQYLDYNTFLHAAKEAWEKGFDNSGLNQDHNVEAPYMRGRELDEHADFDTTNLYKFLKDALYHAESNGLDYAETAQALESALNENFNISKKISEGNVNPNVNSNSQIDRPKDAEGNPITLKARVEDVNTGTIGHVIRFGVDENGNQTVHVDWMYSFGDAIVKPITYPKQIVVRDENRIVREDEIEEGMGHSHTVGRGQNLKPGNYPQTLKRVGLKENLDQAIPIDSEVFLVVDNDFNRAHYKDLIGKTFADAPGYAQVEIVKPGEVTQTAAPVAEDFDYSGEERAFHNQPEIDTINQGENEAAANYIPESIIKFFIPGTFHNDGGSINYKLKIPKQSDETVKDIEQFVKTELLSPNANLYTELEKGTNNWIINVNTTK